MGEANTREELKTGRHGPVCASCLFAKPIDKVPTMVVCRRVPPIAMPLARPGNLQGQMIINFVSAFPEMGMAEWCGEHVPLHAAVAQAGIAPPPKNVVLDLGGETSDF